MSDAETRLALRMLAGSILNRFRIVFSTGDVDSDVSAETPLPVTIISGGGGGGGGGDASAVNQTAQIALTGALTEAAPATDTASSGLNGRLQRIAQRLTSLVALLPASIGAKTASGSLSVTLATDQPALPMPTNATTTRAYDFVNGQRRSFSAISQRSNAVIASEVMLHASARCFVRIGNGAVEASVGPGSFPLEAGEKFHCRLTSGQFVAVIRDTADGFLTVVPVA